MDNFVKDGSAMTQAGLNLIQQALTIYDSNLRLVICNSRFGEMFNLPPELTIYGAEFSKTIHHLVEKGEYGNVAEPKNFVNDRVNTARAFEPHYMERTRSNGQVISVEGSPLPQGGWVTVYTDITSIKRQENMLRSRSKELSGQLLSHAEELAAKNRQLESTNAALEEAKRELTDIEARTRLITEMMPAHISYVNQERRYTYSNQALTSVMPERPTDILGRSVAETLGTSAYAQIEPSLAEGLQGKSKVFEFTDELSSRRIRTAFTPDINGNKINGVYVMSTDVTEETQARAALQHASKRQMAAQLTSGLAHDFANLLTIILGTQSRLEKMQVPSEAQPLLAAIKDAASRGGTLLNTIADMTGARNLCLQTASVPILLEKLSTLTQSALPAKIKLVIRNKLPENSYLLDIGLLQDALLNLILNARDAIGPKGRITVTAQEVKTTWIEFIITDTGPGFSEEALDHGLDPFFTTKGVEGTGLGLTMVYDMVKISGGEMAIGNNYAGARVVLRLPLRKGFGHQASGMVLLVEDSPDLRDTIRAMLTHLGHSVVEATSVVEARQLIAGLPEIALILCDLKLEGVETGVDLAENMDASGPPFIFMTSLPEPDELHQKALRLGPVLPKPFNQGKLKEVMQNGYSE